MRRRALRRHWTLLLGASLAALGARCGGGDGSSGSPAVRVSNADPRCLTLSAAFPSGFDLLPGGGAVAIQVQPPSALGLELSGSAPVLLATAPIPGLPADSDGDGVDDGLASESLFGRNRRFTALLGSVEAVADDLVLVSASNYEELLAFDPASGALRELRVETPPAQVAGDAPFLPAPGTSALRTAISTRRCVYPATALDSRGDPLGAEPLCPGAGPSYFTSLTAGSALAGERIFVATSNLRSSAAASFRPGTLLVFELDLASAPPRVRPDARDPVIFTSGFNPTQVTAHRNAQGRELLLVTLTGAIGAGSGPGNVRGEGAVDVIDAETRRLVATIPLGAAGPSFDDLAIDPSGRIALLGASSQLQLYAIDLHALDAPALFAGLAGGSVAPPIRLDGSEPGFPDARIYTAADPLVLPDRSNGPASSVCDGLTHAAIGGLGTRAFASDFCDGSLSVLSLDLSAGPVPLPRERIRVLGSQAIFAPNVPGSLTRLRAPGILRVRPGKPGIDFQGPDGFVLAGQPEGAVCALHLDSF